MAGSVNTLDALIAQAAAARSDAPALSDHKTTLTYAELESAVALGAHQLQAAGVREDDRVMVYAPKTVDAVVAVLSALRAGAAYVPVDPNAPPARAAWVARHAGVRAIVSFGRAGALWKKSEDSTLPVVDLKAAAPTTDYAAVPENADRLAYILYTSGSTGEPKGVAITHRQSLAFVEPAAALFEAKSSDVFAAHAPLNFDLSIIDLFCAFYAHAHTVLIPETWIAFPKKIAQHLERFKATVWNSVPSALIQLAERGGLADRDLADLRLVMFAGEPMAHDKLVMLQDILPQASFLNVYGQTEANSSLAHPVTRPPKNPLPIGQPIAPMEVLLIDDEGRVVDTPDTEGELVVVSGTVATGYYQDPDKSRDVFISDPRGGSGRAYATRDRAVFDAQGDFYFRGRRDRAVKVRGYRVELAEVEAQLTALLGCRTACLAVPHEDEGHRLVAFSEHEPPPDLKAQMAKTLPGYMLPQAFLHQTPWPTTGTGKTDRKALLPTAIDAAA